MNGARAPRPRRDRCRQPFYAEASTSRVESRIVGITADLKTKGLGHAKGRFFVLTAFIKFRGPQALKDKLEWE